MRLLFSSGFICLLAIASLGACQHEVNIAGQLEDYRQRLGRVFEIEFAKPALDRKDLRPPEPRTLGREIPRLTVNFWQFLQLSDCELNRAIGEHNSILSRHQGASEALFHDANFVHLARACLEQAEDPRAQPLPLLAQAMLDKRESFAVRLANATVATQEFENFFSVHRRLQSPAAIAAQTPEIVDAIETLIAITKQLQAAVAAGSPSPETARAQFDRALGRLQTHKFAGQVLASMQATSAQLNSISDAVEAALVSAEICRQTSGDGQVLLHPRRADALEYLFRQVYLARIQPSAGIVDKAAQAVRQLESLTALLGEQTPAQFQLYWRRHWSFAAGSQVQQYRLAIRRHSAMWQKLLAQCDILQLPPIALRAEHGP